MAEEVAALRHQGEVPAVDGTDVEADVKCLGQLLLYRVEVLATVFIRLTVMGTIRPDSSAWG